MPLFQSTVDSFLLLIKLNSIVQHKLSIHTSWVFPSLTWAKIIILSDHLGTTFPPVSVLDGMGMCAQSMVVPLQLWRLMM